MPVDPLTRQRLLELVYDLLAEPEAAELRRRIASDAELAAAYEEARRTADLLSEAARRAAPKIDLRRAHRAAVPASAVRGRAARRRTSPWARGANWAVSIAATILLAFSLGGYIYHRRELADLAASHMRLLVTGPSRLEAGMANTYAIAASTVTGAPLATKIELALYSPAGKPLLRQEEDTDAEGRARFKVPAELKLADSARLEVSAVYRNKHEKLDAQLPVVPERYAAHLELDGGSYRPGDPARFRAVVLSRFNLTPDRDQPVRVSIADAAGRTLSGFPIEIRSEHGVASGEWAVPRLLAAGRYTLRIESPGGLFASKSQPLEVRADQPARLDKQLEFSRGAYRPGDTVVAYFAARRSDGQPAAGAAVDAVATVRGAAIYQATGMPLADGPLAIRFPLPPSMADGDARLAVTVRDSADRETIARPIPLADARIDLRFQPESGSLVAGLRNRVYFAASDGAGQPVEFRGVVVDSRDQEVADLETSQAGMGLFSITPSAGEQYRVRIIAPVGARQEPALPDVSSETKLVLTTGPGVFGAGRPLEFQIDSLRGGLPLVVAAYCRGVLVGQQALVTNDNGQQNKVALPLAPEACGAIRLAVYEYRADRPRSVAERLVYRRPERRLELAIRDGDKPYPPGHKLKLAFEARNEKGEPVPARLGVVAVDADSSGGKFSLAMPADFYFDGQVSDAQRLGDPNLYLAEDPKAASALDLLLGMQARPAMQLVAGGRAADEAQPPAVLDNLGQIRAEYERNLASYRAERTKALNTLTTLSFFGGLGLVLLVAMLATLKVVSGIRLWVPAFGAATACLVVGATLMNPDRFQPGLGAAVAYMPYRGTTELAMDTKTESPASLAADLAAKEKAEQKALPAAPAPAAPAAARADSPPDEANVAARTGAAVMRQPIMQRQQEMEEAQQGGAVDKRLGESPARRKGAADRLRSLAGPLGAAPVPQPLRAGKPLDEAATRHTPATPILAWHPALTTDASGRSQLVVALPAAGTYSVRADGYGAGRLGRAERCFQSQVPCRLEPRVPAELSVGDQLDLPVLVANPTSVAASVELGFTHGSQLKLQGESRRKFELKPGESRRELFRLEAVAPGRCPLQFRARAGAYAELAERRVNVLATGYPVERFHSGRLRGDQRLTVELPEWLPGSLEASLCAMPTLMAELEQAYASMAQRAEGCAEQPAAQAWIAALALEAIQRSEATWPEVVRQWRERLEGALVRLARYEAPPHGFGAYQWFGGHPANEVLSALVLAALDDARRASGRAAGEDHLAAWLRGRLEANGSLRQEPKAPPSRAAPELQAAYVIWALAGHDPKLVEGPVKQLAAATLKSDDLERMALAAIALGSAGAKAEAASLLDRLAAAIGDDGQVAAKPTPGAGRDCTQTVETNALAAIAFLQRGRTLQAERALGWLAGARLGDGSFGPPLSTALVLKALAEQAKAHPVAPRDGKIALRSGDALWAEQAYRTSDAGPVVLAGLERRFRPGKTNLSLSLTAVGSIAYTLRFTFTAAKPVEGRSPITIATRLENAQVRLGQKIVLTVELGNTSDRACPLALAAVGLPAGLEPQADPLQQLKKQGVVDQFAVEGRRLTLYWRALQPKQRVAIQLELLATASGRFQGPASVGYLYHSPEAKGFAAPLAVEVAP